MKLFPKTALVLPATLAVLLASSCIIVVDGDGTHHWHDSWSSHNSIRGSGVAKTETRTVTDFRGLQVNGSCDVTLTVGSATSLTATADDNLLSDLVTEVRDGTLVVEMKSGSYSPQVAMKVVATVPALDSVSVRGSADVDVAGVAGDRFSVEVSGSGNVHAAGKTGSVTARVSGSGDVKLFDLEAREATVEVSGSGDVDVWATESLATSIAGSGDVTYKGDPPKLSKSVAGSGSVRKH
jgi:hypothetical protein